MPITIGRDPFTNRCIQVRIDGESVSQIQETEEHATCWIAPGFVDLQVNGYQGVDLNTSSSTAESVLRLTHLLAAAGTTTYVPTIITAAQEDMVVRLRAIAEARERYPEVQHAVPAIHLEGPAISPQEGYRGAHPAVHVRPPSIVEFNELQSAARECIRLVTLSPHWPESDDFIQALRKRGVVVSIGHTHATPGQIRDAVDSGATLSTHLGNGIAAQLPRHPNPIWTQLADDHLSATFIADGAHLSTDTFRAMLRAKTVERSILISDSVALAGSVAGEYHSAIGGDVVVESDGSIRMRESGLLAGSGIALKDAIARAPGLSGCTLAEAVRMATQNPAAALQLRSGSIEVGAAADIVLFRWSEADTGIEIVEVRVRGKSVPIR